MANKKFSAEQLQKMKVYWDKMKEAQDRFYTEISGIEHLMENELNIGGIEFFWCDNSIVGIGTADREYELVQFDFMEEE